VKLMKVVAVGGSGPFQFLLLLSQLLLLTT
jgi:hypothetical protein